MALNTALPTTVPIPPEKPLASFKKLKRKWLLKVQAKNLK